MAPQDTRTHAHYRLIRSAFTSNWRDRAVSLRRHLHVGDCRPECGDIFLPFWDECGGLLSAMGFAGVHEYADFANSCQVTSSRGEKRGGAIGMWRREKRAKRGGDVVCLLSLVPTWQATLFPGSCGDACTSTTLQCRTTQLQVRRHEDA